MIFIETTSYLPTVNVRGLLGIRRMDRVSNAQIRKLCRVKKGLNKRIDGVLQLFGHVVRMKNHRIAKRVYVGKCADSCSIVHDRCVWRDFVRGNAWGNARWVNT